MQLTRTLQVHTQMQVHMWTAEGTVTADVVAAGSALQPKKHPFWCDYLYGEKTSWNTKLQAAGVAAAVA